MALYIDGIEQAESETVRVSGDYSIYVPSGNSIDMYIGGSKVFDLSSDGAKTTIIGLSGDYWQIGTQATDTSHSLASENDLFIVGKLEVDGASFFDGIAYHYHQLNIFVDNIGMYQGAGDDTRIVYRTTDANAKCMILDVDESADSGNNVPAWVFGERTNIHADLGLLDEVVQPHLVTMENSGKYTSATDATCDTGNKDELLKTGGFTAAAIGDVVRITAGSGTTITGWYWITNVTGNDSVTLDRDMCTGSVTGINFVAFHGLSMVTPRAIYLPIYDGAPQDSDIDIDMAGALALELSQANGRLYWRVGDAWHYVDASAGLSMPVEERIDPDGKEFNIGDTVKLVVDRINNDGSFHAMPYRRN